MGDSPIYIKSITLTKKTTDGINKLDKNDRSEIVSEKYYTIDGREINTGYLGIKIKKTTYKNGNIEVKKCL